MISHQSFDGGIGDLGATVMHLRNHWETGRLWSLWEVLQINAKLFLGAVAELERMQVLISAPVNARIDYSGLGSIRNHLYHLLIYLDDMELPVTAAAAKRLHNELSETLEAAMDNDEDIGKEFNVNPKFSEQLGSIRVRMEDELGKTAFLCLGIKKENCIILMNRLLGRVYPVGFVIAVRT